MACIRLAASGHTRLAGPSMTDADTSWPRWAGRQWRKTASGAAARHERVVDAVAGEGVDSRGGLGFLPHRYPGVGEDGIGAGHRVTGRGHLADVVTEAEGALERLLR